MPKEVRVHLQLDVKLPASDSGVALGKVVTAFKHLQSAGHTDLSLATALRDELKKTFGASEVDVELGTGR